MASKIATGYELTSFYDANWGELIGTDVDDWEIDGCDWLSASTIDDLDIDSEVILNSSGRIIWVGEGDCSIKKIPTPLSLFRKWQKKNPNTCLSIEIPTKYMAQLDQFLALTEGQIIPRGSL